MFSLRQLSIMHIQNLLQLGDIALDCTVGNGHDTLFLADLVGQSGRVEGFDVQEQALQNAARLLGARPNVHLHLTGHENLEQVLGSELQGRIQAAMFNLGYLPGSDKDIVTCPQTTLACLEALQTWLAPGGGISVHIYMGHGGGEVEGEAVLAFARRLNWQQWQVGAYEMLNKKTNREILLLLQKRKDF